MTIAHPYIIPSQILPGQIICFVNDAIVMIVRSVEKRHSLWEPQKAIYKLKGVRYRTAVKGNGSLAVEEILFDTDVDDRVEVLLVREAPHPLKADEADVL